MAILCLPDDAAKESVRLIDNDTTKVIDASTCGKRGLKCNALNLVGLVLLSPVSAWERLRLENKRMKTYHIKFWIKPQRQE